MSLGGRIILRRGEAALSASICRSSAPWEPLIFLYPRWVRNAATALQGLDIDDARKPSSGSNHISSNVHTSQLSSGDGNAACAASNHKSAVEKKDESAFRTPDSTGSFFRRIVASDMNRAARKVYNSRIRGNYEQLKLKEREAPLPDWREILIDLQRYTTDGSATWFENVLKIEVPSQAIGKLLFNEDDNIWSIKLRCGCQIEVPEIDEATQEHRPLLVSGPITNIAKAAAEILQIVRGAVSDNAILSKKVRPFNTRARDPRPSLSVDGILPEVVRSVQANDRRRMAAPIRADKIPRPDTWTRASFGKYVQHLTSSKMSTHIQSLLYKPGESHVHAVMDILEALFLNPQCKPAISTAAFNDALAYFVKHNAMEVVRELYVHMEMLHLKMNTETFNIMLRGAAKSESLHNFRYIFGLMLRRGHNPNSDTWVTFMEAVQDFRIKRWILVAMKRKELVHDPRIQKAVCENLVRLEFESSLENKISQEQFLQHMADCYGPDWLTTSSGNRVLDVLGSRGLISRCWEFLMLMHARDVKPGIDSILTILHHCRRHRNAQGAIEIIRQLSSVVGFDADQEIYDTLFSIAWEARLYYVAQVVWRYACLDAATTYRMRRRVSDSVQSALSDQLRAFPSTVRGRWKATAGPFILGIPFSAPLEDQASLRRHLSAFSPAALAGNSDKEIVIAEAERQMRVFEDWVPQRHFADVLVEAFATDCEWTSSGARYGEKSMQWLAARAPAVPLKRKVALEGIEKNIIWGKLFARNKLNRPVLDHDVQL